MATEAAQMSKAQAARHNFAFLVEVVCISFIMAAKFRQGFQSTCADN
jgi:hypothetical protein